jgi:hypothetical protein
VSGLLDWFAAKPVEDPRLGTLQRRHGTWRGTISLEPQGETVLRIGGGRGGPDPANLAVARGIVGQFDAWRPLVEAALFEHYDVWRDALAREEQLEEDLPDIAAADAVWAHVEPVYVLVEPLSGTPAPGPVVELAYRTAWDIEHTVAARMQDGRLLELCGSVWVGPTP